MPKNRETGRDNRGLMESGNRPQRPLIPENGGRSDASLPARQATIAPGGSDKQQSGSSFAARFGRAIVQHGIAAIPSALFHYQGSLDLSAQEVWFISYVMCFKWDDNLPRVNLSLMEKRVGMGKRSLYRLKERLCEANYLVVSPVYAENGRQDSSAYDFSGLFERLERLILADPPKANPIHTDDTGDPDDDTDEEPADHDMSFMARFGRVIARYGIAAIPQAVFSYQAALGLKPQQVWFISYIFSYQWRRALPYPSIVKMSARTGYSTVQLHEIKASLVCVDYLRLVPRSTRFGGKDTNAYDFSGLFDAIREQLQRELNQSKRAAKNGEKQTPEIDQTPRPSRRRGRAAAQNATQKRTSHEGDSRLSWEGDSELSYQGDTELIWEGESEQRGESDSRFAWEGDAPLTWESDAQLAVPASNETPTRVTRSSQRRVTRGLHKVEAIQEKKKNRDDSNHNSNSRKELPGGNKTASSPQSPYINAILQDFSHELQDPDHQQSNATQALHLWQASGLSEQEFVQLIYRAKQLTREYQGKNGARGIENRMAYFFAVLRDLCGLRERLDSGGSLTEPKRPKNAPQPGMATPTGRAPSRRTIESQDTSMPGVRQLWQAALTELQASVPAQSYQTWLKNTSILAINNGVVVVAVPSNFAKEWLEKRYSKQIAETLRNVLGYRAEVRFEVVTQSEATGRER